jgi:phosphatidylglycerol lysyltransferase
MGAGDPVGPTAEAPSGSEAADAGRAPPPQTARVWIGLLVALLIPGIWMWTLPDARFHAIKDAFGWNLTALLHDRFHLLWIDLFLVPDRVLPPFLITFSVVGFALAERRFGWRLASAAFFLLGPLSSVIATLVAWALAAAGADWIGPQLDAADVVLALAVPFLLGPFLIPKEAYAIGHLTAFLLGWGAGLLVVRPWRRPVDAMPAASAQSSRWPAWTIAAVAAVSGLLEIAHLLFARLGTHRPFSIIPLGAPLYTRNLTLVFALALLYLSFYLFQGRRIAWRLAVASCSVLVISYMDPDEPISYGVVALIALGLLVAFRQSFTVRSQARAMRQAFAVVASGLTVAISYGTLGFYLMSKADFGVDFDAHDALVATLNEYVFLGHGELVPQTQHARWFLGSLGILGAATLLFAAAVLVRPVRYRFQTRPQEKETARKLLALHGRSDVDYFKLHGPKSFFFSSSGKGMIAYAVAAGVAVALGEPVGPEPEMEKTLREWTRFCRDHAWQPALLHLPPDRLSIYEGQGLRVVKIGEVARVDLDRFVHNTGVNKHFARIDRRFANLGCTAERHAPPHPAPLMAELERVSQEWLTIPGRREHGFAMGRFDHDYMQQTPVHCVRGDDGALLAFVNEPPTFVPGEATVDLMRHVVGIPNGTMDFLLASVMRDCHARGYRSFDLGLAPLARVDDWPGAGIEERTLAILQGRMRRMFSFRGLLEYKQKFDPNWEPSFLAYRGGPAGLVRSALAASRLLRQ